MEKGEPVVTLKLSAPSYPKKNKTMMQSWSLKEGGDDRRSCSPQLGEKAGE
jgi:hypothetical protein